MTALATAFANTISFLLYQGFVKSYWSKKIVQEITRFINRFSKHYQKMVKNNDKNNDLVWRESIFNEISNY